MATLREDDRGRTTMAWLLAVLLGLGALLLAVWLAADPATIGEDGWRTTAAVAWAVGAAAVGIGLVVVVLALAPPVRPVAAAVDDDDDDRRRDDRDDEDSPSRSVAARAAVAGTVVAVVAVLAMGATVVIGLADAEGHVEEAAPPEVTGAPVETPAQVAIQLTTAGRRKAARAMGCTPDLLQGEELTGWVVGGDFQEPIVVIFSPARGCTNGRVALESTDGFVFPTLLFPEDAGSTTPTTAAPG